MYDISHLLERAQRYAAATGKTHSAVSAMIFKDGVRLTKLINRQCTCTLPTAAAAWKKLDELELALVDQLLEDRAA